MALFSRILQAVRSWRRRRGGSKTVSSRGVSVEHLDHRQLLSVNFTGNVATDFPASLKPGVVILPNNPSVSFSPLAPEIAPIVKVAGWDINGIRVEYTPADDTLSVGLEQPLSQQPDHPGPVIAGDADNNGNDGTVNPLVIAAEGPGFRDFPSFGGSEHMAAFLDLKGSGNADVVAGFSTTDPRSPKEYQVAQAVVNGTPEPDFGTRLPNYEGNVYKVNSQAHPNLEFSITHFSQLYTAETGKALTADSMISIGAFAGSGDDPGIGEALFPSQPFRLGDATPPTPPPPPVCPPVSPPVIINVHENRHINTAHDTLIRVNVLGSSGFNVANIDPATVTLGGAHPVFSFDRFINNDEWPDATFVFKGTDVHLPPGYTEATVTGNLTNGTSFSSSVRVFNRDSSYYSPSQALGVQQRESGRATRQNGFTILPNGSPLASARGIIGTPTVATPTPTPTTVTIPGLTAPAPLKVSMTTQAGTAHAVTAARSDAAAGTGAAHQVVSIKRREPVVSGQAPAVKAAISPNLQASMNRYVRSVGAVNQNTGVPVASGGR